MKVSEIQDYCPGESPWGMSFFKQIDSFAFKPLLIDRLLNATSNYLADCPSQQIDFQTPVLMRETIPLKRSKEIETAIYISAIAQKLQKSQQKSPIEIAQAIEGAIELSPDFTVEAIDGWIQFQIAESGLGNWLQRLNQWPSQTHRTELPQNRESQPKFYSARDLFAIEYAHARCCSLLRLGDREGLIALSEPTLCDRLGDRQILSPSPIPWLNDRNQLRLVHLTERTLISRLITTLDTLSDFQGKRIPTQFVKLATLLSQNFLTFESKNRIWGDVKTTNLALPQARLGLIRATQIVLKLLLEEALGVMAPTEM